MTPARDRVVSVVFLALGTGLIVSSFALPAGMGGLPGPGFFPRVIGGAIVALALALLWRSRGRASSEATSAPDARGVLGAIGLLALYLLLWGSGLFALRTAVFLLLLLRFLGQPWKTGLAVSISLTAAIVLAFQVGLGVSLS